MVHAEDRHLRLALPRLAETFYPPKLAPPHGCRTARYFDTVEINNSFYRLPESLGLHHLRPDALRIRVFRESEPLPHALQATADQRAGGTPPRTGITSLGAKLGQSCCNSRRICPATRRGSQPCWTCSPGAWSRVQIPSPVVVRGRRVETSGAHDAALCLTDQRSGRPDRAHRIVDGPPRLLKAPRIVAVLREPGAALVGGAYRRGRRPRCRRLRVLQ